MKKRILAFILSLTMLVGIAPVSAIDVNATETDKTIAENITGNSFTDTTAKASESYVYTVEGSDGSVKEIVVPAESSETVETGNRVVEETGENVTVGDTKYVKTAELKSGETYLLVNGNNALVTDDASVSMVEIGSVTINDDDTITGPLITYEWTITETDKGYTLVNSNGKYLNMGNTYPYSVYPTYVIFDVMLSEDSADFIISSNNNGTFNLALDNAKGNGYDQYVYFNGQDVTPRDSQKTPFTFYAKEEVTSSATFYTIDTTGLDTLIAECDALSSRNYTADSWSNFKTALANAKNIKASLAESYDTADAANAALAEVDTAHKALLAAKNALEQSESSETTTTVDLTWQRTLENKSTAYDDDGELLNDVEYIMETDDGNYSVVSWKNNANAILGLSTDPSMTVWDYGTDSQYATSIPQVAGVEAATWNEHARDEYAWRIGTVRRFTGTFIWPEGYDTDDTIVCQSVNDDNYDAIYDYINSDPDLKERFGTSKVFPVNDDMFVFIHKADDPLTVDNYLEHMLFWSGTSGKGVWSTDRSIGSGDWDRTTPATFNGVNALPAYYGIMPNNNDITGEKATVDGLDITTMRHSDDWYTLVDSNVIMSTIKRIYGVEDLSNQEMVIEIFSFDNSGNGGMDKIEFHFEKIPETTTTVQINYYLDSVLASNFIGSSLMSGLDDGAEITLLSGTTVNELDYYRFAAATKAGTVVSNGVQQDAVPYVVDIDKEYNIINVVYTSNNADDKVYYFYDFGVENQYVYTPKEDAVLNQNYKITKVENSDSRIKASISDDKKAVLLSYTPMNSEGEVASGILNIEFDGAYEAEVKPIVIAPASNVLFEENFMKQSTITNFADWIQGGTVDATSVTDNENSVFGYTDSYKTSVGESGTYTATVNSTTKFTDNLEVEFGGTGFDLIGTCGPNTGTIAVRIVNSAGAAVKNYLVDTLYADTTGVVSEGTTIYQVPLIQAKDLPEDVYTVTIRGAYIVYENTSAASSYSMNRVESADETDPVDDIYELLYGVGMTEDDIETLEYINMGRLMGASTYAANADASEPIAAPTEMMIGIDGLRSYRATDYRYYPTKELGVTYYNILDCVGDGFAAYIETSADGTYQVNEYELSGGPQNEIYIVANGENSGTTQGEVTALTIAKTNSISKQISLRSVDGQPVKVNVNGGDGQPNGITINLNHTTEMYYEAPANGDGYIVLQVVSGFLGIGNLKLTSGNAIEAATVAVELMEEDYEIVSSAMRLYASGHAPDSDIGNPEDETPDKDESGPEKPEGETPDKDESEPEKPEGEISDKDESGPEKPEGETSDKDEPEPEKPEGETPGKDESKPEKPEGGVPEKEGLVTKKPEAEMSPANNQKAEKPETGELQPETLDVEVSETETPDVEKEQTESTVLSKGIRFGIYAAVIVAIVVIIVFFWKKYQNEKRKRGKK